MTLENKRSVLQKHNGSQKLSQIENPRLFRGKFQHSNFRNKFITVFHSCVRVVILLCFLSQLKAEEKRIYHNLTEALQNPTDVQILYLNSNQLITLPKEIGKLKKLRELHSYNNQLKAIPKEIGELKELQMLDLSHNQFKTLPKEFGNLQNLQILELIGNQLTTLPKEIGKLKNLRELNLSRNQLTTLPKEIGHLKNLQELYLDDIPAWRSQEEKIRKLLPEVKIIFIEIEK
ncbi:leucine rich repeat protein [Leptospira weilii str. Ecochallenge]|uniref:Leucine rich repeat protein n=1 Tax=Leptospira weilii str. Ecochallenge TaxID=1049986 RepID=N1UE74_9LEPT|nr:leucine rich repeat protein [Leptospira weilii str. Ecochallenge]